MLGSHDTKRFVIRYSIVRLMIDDIGLKNDER